MSEAWDPYAVKASWVAVFILFLLWWLAHAFRAFFHKSTSVHVEEGIVTTEKSAVVDNESKAHRVRRLARHFRDGLLFLLTAVALNTVARGPFGATNSFAWIFTGIWIILAALQYFAPRRERLLAILKFMDIILLVALISDAFAHPANLRAA